MIKVLITDDQQLFRDLLDMMLSNSEEIQVVGSAKNGDEAIGLIKEHQPDLVLMDLSMPVCSGLEAIRKMKEEKLSTKILVLSASTGEHDLYEAIRFGADGFVPKDISKQELLLAIRSVVSGLEVIHEDIRKHARQGASRIVSKRGDKTIVTLVDFEVELSERELEIIKMIIDGLTTGEMAKTLFLTEGRVRNIITEIISKLMLKDRTQLAVFAIKNGIVS